MCKIRFTFCLYQQFVASLSLIVISMFAAKKNQVRLEEEVLVGWQYMASKGTRDNSQPENIYFLL